MSFTEHSTVIATPVFEDIEASSRHFVELASVFGKDVFAVAVDDGERDLGRAPGPPT
jgi:hypothetical protein